jgi:hypothetical protein
MIAALVDVEREVSRAASRFPHRVDLVSSGHVHPLTSLRLTFAARAAMKGVMEGVTG